jgi:branched-chain amino acid transport system ATP-binding protein
MMLKLENVSTGYGKRQVLFDVSFTIKQGEIVLLIGANGSGKSTLLKYIYGLLPPFKDGSGKVLFDNEDITEAKPSDLISKGLVYIPQKNNVFDNLTVKDNLEVSGLSLRNKNVFKQRYNEALELFPILKDLLNRLPMKLSGGERQLLAFAMTSLHKPKMILADEPFAGLSHKNIEIVKHQIQKLKDELGITFLIVEHKVKESYLIVNKVLGLKLGKIIMESEINTSFNIVELNTVFV